ncbi:MAG: tryptophan synthase subunit alpha [Bacteroidota bacterium]
MNERFKQVVAEAAASNRKLAGLFLTNGFPDLASSRELLTAIDRGGADFIELGMPFSDPLAEGLPIQRSSERALAGGLRMADTLETARLFRKTSETPLFLMGYANPILRYGLRSFFMDAREVGVDGVILPDVPPGESEEILEAAGEAGLGMVQLIAPNSSDERIRLVDQTATGFVYAVSVTGLTGSAISSPTAVQQYLHRARQLVTRNPLLVGFGISSRREAESLSRFTDGFIVGSALIKHIESLWEDAGLSREARLRLTQEFVEGLTGRSTD